MTNFILYYFTLQTLLLTIKQPEKQPSRGVLKKKFSQSMQQIFSRTPMPKVNFNKVAKDTYKNTSGRLLMQPGTLINRPENSLPKNISQNFKYCRGNAKRERKYTISIPGLWQQRSSSLMRIIATC